MKFFYNVVILDIFIYFLISYRLLHELITTINCLILGFLFEVIELINLL
jgi:hypothetical protein